MAGIGRKSKTMRTTGIMNNITTGAGIIGGMALGGLASKNLPATVPPIAVAIIKILGAGYVAKTGKGQIMKAVAGGVAASAVSDLITQFGGPGLKSSLGLTGIGAFRYQLAPGSTALPGVAGGAAVGRRANLVGMNNIQL
jgi:hypothetical protein